MIIKTTIFMDIVGHLDNPKEVSEILSQVLCDYLAEGPSINSDTKRKIKLNNPKFEKLTFICHDDVLERIRKSS